MESEKSSKTPTSQRSWAKQSSTILILLGLDPTLNQQPPGWEVTLGPGERPTGSRLPNWHGQFKVIDFLEEQPERWLSMGKKLGTPACFEW